ncbi:MAG: Fe-S cluster assembly ATPase SufC [Flavobacteriales bacterium]|nr:Fe-S cluster assembly ATPase SufC [Flavobacteriales bacterium]
MLKIKNLACTINDTPVLNGLNLNVKAGEVHAIMGPNGSGKSTLASIVAGDEKYTITNGDIELFNKSIIDLAPELRAAMGVFLSFQYPVEIPGVSVSNFIKIAVNEQRKHNGLDPMGSTELLQEMKKNLELLKMDSSFLSRYINDGFSGGEKKRNEIFQMSMLKPKLAILDETDSGLDIDALKIVANGVNSLRSSENAFIIITHYQRLLNYIKPDHVHILANGSIVKSAGPDLALELEAQGYAGIIK